MTNEIRYSRWYTARTVVADALDIFRGLADFGCILIASYLVATAGAALLGQSTFDTTDAPALALLGLSAIGAGRTLSWLLGEPAEWARPGWGVFPGRFVPVPVQDEVLGFLTGSSAAVPVRDIAEALGVPRPTVASALSRLSARGRAVRVWPNRWTAADGGQPTEVDDGPQIPLSGNGDER